MKKHILKNNDLGFTVLSDWGCHWADLRINLNGKWHDLLDPVTDYEGFMARKPSLGSYVMAPWPNRIAQARFKFAGKNYELRQTFPDGTAIHGDVRHRPWDVLRSTEERFEATLDSRCFKDFNYPFALVFNHQIELQGRRIIVRFYMTNVDRKAAPAGFGFHPFLKRKLTEKDSDLVVILPAEKVYPQERCITAGEAIPVSGRFDLRSEQPVGARDLDHCYTALNENKIRMIYAGSRVRVDFGFDPIFSHAVIYAPNESDGNPRSFVAVEPQTMVTDGFNLHERGWRGTGVKILEPGQSWGGTWEISIHQF